MGFFVKWEKMGYIMNESFRIHSSFAYKFLSFGIVVGVLTLTLFLFKHFTGYNDVTYVGDFSDCHVKVERTYYNEHYYYNVAVECKELDNYSKSFRCSKRYYKDFLDYNGKNVELSFYKTDSGIIFPVHKLHADEHEAEIEYRHIDPPTLWYSLYTVGTILSVAFITMGLKANHTAANYKNTPAIKKPTAEQKEMCDEIDRILAEDKYGKYKNKTYK